MLKLVITTVNVLETIQCYVGKQLTFERRKDTPAHTLPFSFHSKELWSGATYKEKKLGQYKFKNHKTKLTIQCHRTSGIKIYKYLWPLRYMILKLACQ